MIAKEEILDAILVTCCAKTLPQRYALVLIVSLPDTTQPRPAEEWRGGWRSHRGASVRGPHAAEHGVSSAGDARSRSLISRSLRQVRPIATSAELDIEPLRLERCRRFRWKHGARSKAVRDLLRANRQRWRALLVLIGE